MKKITALFAALAVMVSLCGCCMKHSWADATCTEPKICTKCGATEGEPNGHLWEDATCTEPKTCAECGAAEGEPNGHLFSDWFVESEDFAEMTRSLARTCSACGEVEYGTQKIKLDYDRGTIIGDPAETTDSLDEASSEFWTFDNATGTLYINYEGDMPDTENGCPWGHYSDDIKKIIISDRVTSISDWAFSVLFSLSSVDIPGSVENIGFSAFSNCYELTEVNIGDGVKTIGAAAFYCCHSLKSIVLPDSITNIGAEAFSGCENLSDVSIPPHAVIEERVFSWTLTDAESDSGG